MTGLTPALATAVAPVRRRSALRDLEPEARTALSKSILASVPEEALDRLVRDAILIDVPAGGSVLREGHAAVNLLVTGVVRLYMTAPSGRQTTLRYIRPSELLGVATLFGGTAHVGARALTDSRLLVFRSGLLREAALADGQVALAFLREVSVRVTDYVNELGSSVFTTVRQRVVRHLLDSSVLDPSRGAVVATVSQQELADAAGSLRETVVRVLRDLREAGLVLTGRDGIVLVDPMRLEEELWIPGR